MDFLNMRVWYLTYLLYLCFCLQTVAMAASESAAIGDEAGGGAGAEPEAAGGAGAEPEAEGACGWSKPDLSLELLCGGQTDAVRKLFM